MKPHSPLAVHMGVVEPTEIYGASPWQRHPAWQRKPILLQLEAPAPGSATALNKRTLLVREIMWLLSVSKSK